MKIILIVLLLLASTSRSWAGDEAEANARALASAVHDYMIATYGCQKYVGGLSMYQSAKQTAEDTFVQMGVNKNKAVILIDRGEDKIKQAHPEKKIEEMKEENGVKLTESDKREGCLQTISDARDKVRLFKAKLSLLNN
tara:strand:+ start:95 stop:511 length:417 start_codon:yes stop_codon:yes gene_type:complete